MGRHDGFFRVHRAGHFNSNQTLIINIHR
jgi:hypothetical protein